MAPRINLDELGRRLNLARRPRSWVGTCPACSYPRVFSLRLGRRGGVLAYCANGCTPHTLNDALTRVLNTDWMPVGRSLEQDIAKLRDSKREAAWRMFIGSTPVTVTDPAGLYLARRWLTTFVTCPAMRYRGDCRHPEGGRLPALVAEIVDCEGRPVAVHRTYLSRDGRKASVDPVKASLGPVWGAAVRLTPDPTPPAELVVGEGIETAASAGLLLGLPAWAALSAGNLGTGLILPSAVRAVTVAADNDPVGLKRAQAAAQRWRAEGRTVQIVAPIIAGQDFNDILQQHSAAQIEAGSDDRNR